MAFPPDMRKKVRQLDQTLLERYGSQGWWPTTVRQGEPPVYHPGREGKAVSDDEAFEIIVGSILTQNTAWTNVEKALVSLTGEGLLNLNTLSHCDARLEAAIRPSGYFNQKAARLRGIAAQIQVAGGIEALRGCPTDALRKRLLSWKGIGPETADSILCYAFNRPVFVVDNYTRRLFGAMNLPSGSYNEMQELVHGSLPASAAGYGDFHARIVRLFKIGEVVHVADEILANETKV